jgi:hypothetical protein
VPIPTAWKARALLRYSNLLGLSGMLDGDTLEDVLELAREVSGAIAKARIAEGAKLLRGFS